MIKHIFLLAIGLSGCFVSAQSWEELYHRTNDCWGKDWISCASILEQACEAAEKEFGKQDSLYVVTLGDLGVSYQGAGQFKKSQVIFEEILPLVEQHFGKNHSFYSRHVNNLGATYRYLKSFDKAMFMFQEALRYLDTRDPQYGLCLSYIGHLHGDMGNYQRSLQYMEQAFPYIEQSFGSEHPQYGGILFNIGTAHANLGNYDQAILHIQQAMPFFERFGKDNPEVGRILSVLGTLYRKIGNHEDALTMLNQAKQIFEQHQLEQHPTYGEILSHLGLLWDNLQQWDKAIPFHQEAMQIGELVLGKENPDYGMRLNNLALSLYYQEQYEAAIPLFLEAIRIIKATLGSDKVAYATCINNLGLAYRQQDNHQEAIPLMKKALSITERKLGKLHPDYGKWLFNLGVLHGEIQADTQAITFFRELSEILAAQLSTQFSSLSDKLQLSFIGKKQYQIDFLSAYGLKHPEFPELSAIGYNQQLLLKGLLKHNQTDMLQKLRQSADSAIVQRYEEWEQLHHLLAHQYQVPIESRLPGFDSLVKAEERLEILLANQSRDFREVREQIDWQDIQHQLEPGEAAIEFAHVPIYDFGKKTDQVIYVAYILRSGDLPPQLVRLFEEEDLRAIISSNSQQESIDQLYASRGIRPSRKNKDFQGLKELIWDPIQDLLTDISTIYFSPSGLLHRMNLGAIPLNSRKLLGDTFHLIQVESTRRLMFQDKQEKSKSQTALLLGGINYDMAQESLPLMPDSMSRDYALLSRGGDSQWGSLAGTAQEVASLQQLLNAASYEVDLKTDSEATESYLRFHAQAPTILHIATHGYFFPDPADSRQTSGIDFQLSPPVQQSEHPMVRSGLILAGANKAWQGQELPKGEEDGILTAYEISRMDLSNTELVVLSACETGLGDIQGNEGVYGLQRAFKIAGAKYILMSLWQVPDQATQELMVAFYDKWLGGMEIRAALQAAQKEIRKKYQEPYFWAGFVLLE